MLALVEEYVSWMWAINLLVACVAVAVRVLRHTRGSWAAVGVLFLATAMGNALLVASALANQEVKAHETLPIYLQATSLFGMVVFGSLGSRFLGEWITSGARD